jgi:hypothetical protein
VRARLYLLLMTMTIDGMMITTRSHECAAVGYSLLCVVPSAYLLSVIWFGVVAYYQRKAAAQAFQKEEKVCSAVYVRLCAHGCTPNSLRFWIRPSRWGHHRACPNAGRVLYLSICTSMITALHGVHHDGRCHRLRIASVVVWRVLQVPERARHRALCQE